jgi:hypothetical protein
MEPARSMTDTHTETNQRESLLTTLRRLEGDPIILRAFALTGIFFMLVPGTLLGVMNLITISGHHAAGTASAAWVQAHGHAQFFGWIGTFILGIGYHSLPRHRLARIGGIDERWLCLALWTTGVLLRWSVGTNPASWRVLLPLGSALELAAFLLFLRASSGHRPAGDGSRKPEAWALVVIAGTLGLLVALIANVAVSAYVALRTDSPIFPPAANQRILAIALWAFLVPFVWGFTARWVPRMIGTAEPSGRALLIATLICFAGVIVYSAGLVAAGAAMLLASAVIAAVSLKLFGRRLPSEATDEILPWTAFAVRVAYFWMLAGATLGLIAAAYETGATGVLGAYRHAMTVGFLSVMVFTIGPVVLPVFAGDRVLFSPSLARIALIVLNIGCTLRVVSQIAAYDANAAWAWQLLPISALVELTAVCAFAVNLGLTMAHGRIARARLA